MVLRSISTSIWIRERQGVSLLIWWQYMTWTCPVSLLGRILLKFWQLDKVLDGYEKFETVTQMKRKPWLMYVINRHMDTISVQKCWEQVEWLQLIMCTQMITRNIFSSKRMRIVSGYLMIASAISELNNEWIQMEL